MARGKSYAQKSELSAENRVAYTAYQTLCLQTAA